jgi:competence protein ComEC
VHIQTATHDLLYDAGPIYTPETNAGNRVIVPYLQAAGVGKLHGLLISHQDTDHAGGAADILQAMPVDWLMSSLPARHALLTQSRKALPCYAGQTWIWDGVRFAILHPEAAQLAHPPRKTNALSCVLSVSNAAGKVLLAGDIETANERDLIRRNAAALQADVLLAPHHGSTTSSSPEFVQAVGASTVIFSAGYRNRFNHPRPEIAARYRATGAQLCRTDAEGALTVDLPAEPGEAATGNGGNGQSSHGVTIEVAGERARHGRYWYLQ